MYALRIRAETCVGVVRIGEARDSENKAKFHYASWFGASSELAPNMFEASSEPASVMEFGLYQTLF